MKSREGAGAVASPAPRGKASEHLGHVTKVVHRMGDAELGDEDLVDYEEDEVVDDKPTEEVKKCAATSLHLIVSAGPPGKCISGQA